MVFVELQDYFVNFGVSATFPSQCLSDILSGKKMALHDKHSWSSLYLNSTVLFIETYLNLKQKCFVNTSFVLHKILKMCILTSSNVIKWSHLTASPGTFLSEIDTFSSWEWNFMPLTWFKCYLSLLLQHQYKCWQF